MKPIEPYDYFRHMPYGWTEDCAKNDEDSFPLYDQATIDDLVEQHDILLAAIDKLRKVKGHYHTEQAFNELIALADGMKGNTK